MRPGWDSFGAAAGKLRLALDLQRCAGEVFVVADPQQCYSAGAYRIPIHARATGTVTDAGHPEAATVILPVDAAGVRTGRVVVVVQQSQVLCSS